MPKEVILLIPSIILLAYVVYLRLRTIPRLRKKLRETKERAAQVAAPPENAEVERLRERIHVLERIATERHSSLEQEFDQLRSAR